MSVTKVVNALVFDVTSPAEHLWPAGTSIRLARKMYGGIWVGGKVTINDTCIEFHPNALNRALHSQNLEVFISLKEITDVEVKHGIGTHIIRIIATEPQLTIRCWGANNFANHIRKAAGLPI